MSLLLRLLVVLGLFVANGALRAQPLYPERTVRILVGFPAGGPPDLAARYLADQFASAWGKAVVVENVTGAGGNLAIERAVKAAPDGTTLVMASSAITINSSLHAKPSYDPQRDLVPISIAVQTPSILVVNNDVPASTLPELVRLARAHPDKLTYGHAGPGTPAHLSGELLRSLAGIDIQGVPYRGTPALIPDLLAGRLTMTLPNMSVVLTLVREGKVRALATLAERRAAALPELATAAEQGLPGLEVPIWFGLMAPAGTPQFIVDKVQAATAHALEAPEIRKRWSDTGLEAVGNTQAEFAAIIAAEIPRWKKLIQNARITVGE
jgi:tripartite-type tricarboxylate transporter receptor subunit TctC